MGFYYLNVLSLLFLALIYAVAIFLFWFFWVKGLGRAFSGPLVWLVVATILIAPWIEEFWIAYHFGRMCRDAGIFINKKVETEGFYDDTHGWRADKLRASGYMFVEGRDNSSGANSYWRHEKAGDEVRSFKIDRPSARFQYSWPQRNVVAEHKIYKQTEEVRDVQMQEVLGRSVTFGRNSGWFFVALDDPGMTCPNNNTGVLLYRLVLTPSDSRKGG